MKALQFPCPSSSVNDAIKLKLLSTKLNRIACTKPLKEVRKNGRISTFDNKLVSKHPWLFAGDEGCFCIFCKLFCTAKSRPKVAGRFLTAPFTSYSKIKLVADHEASEYHRDAQITASNFLGVAQGKNPSITTMVTQTVKDEKERKLQLSFIIKSLVICAKQGLPLRGHREAISLKDLQKPMTVMRQGKEIIPGDENLGNFLQQVRFRNDAGDSALQEIVNQRSRYVSPSIQNELLDLISNQITANIVHDIGSSAFTVIADETTDCSNKEQLCLAIRYLKVVDEYCAPTVEEKFMKFVVAESLTGKIVVCTNQQC